MPRTSAPGPALALLALVLLLAPARTARAQSPGGADEGPPPTLGLAASGSVGLFTGAGFLKNATPGAVIGGVLDLGSLRDPFLVRLVLDVSWIYGSVRDRDTLGLRVTGPIYDLAGHLSAEVMLQPMGRFEPFVAAGIGAHAAGSSTSYIPVDDALNANVLGAHVSAGGLVRLRRDSRTALRTELRGMMASAVGRVELRVGVVRLFRDLAAEPPPGRAPRPEDRGSR